MENATERMTVNNAKLERDPVKTVILASMMGTAIEFFDFYAYGTASAAYFPKVFFPQMTPLLATLLSLLTFGVAFVARPVGSFVFGHFGDRLGRKKTLVVSLLVMGVATVAIGFIPGYQSIGVGGALMLCLCRFVQGIGLGGEWSGAVLVATENAPADKRALYGANRFLYLQWFVLCLGKNADPSPDDELWLAGTFLGLIRLGRNRSLRSASSAGNAAV